MPRSLITLLAFFGKELDELRRQPKLVLSLVLGPLAILLLFGMGYKGNNEGIATLLVVPTERLDDPQIATLKSSAKPVFQIVDVVSDEAEAMRRLRRGEVRMVEVLPADAEARVHRGEQAPIEFRYDEINPLEDQWIHFASYVQVIQLNAALLKDVAAATQSQSGGIGDMLADAQAKLEATGKAAAVVDAGLLRPALRQARQVVQALAQSPTLLGAAGAGLRELAQDLAELEVAATAGTLAQERERIERTSRRLAELRTAVDKLSAMPPEVIVSPLAPDTTNLAGASLELMVFYAPGVMALILAHIVVTLAALSLVRERLQGAVEFFAVSPATMSQVLVGKYLGFTFFGLIIAGLLMGVIKLLGVPFLGSPVLFVLLLLLFIVASLGIGFAISAISGSDSQAVQLSMLVLLASMFFSGFFLPLNSFVAPVRYFGHLLPLTHAVSGFQAILLRGRPPDPSVWWSLAAIALVTYAWVALRWGRKVLAA